MKNSLNKLGGAVLDLGHYLKNKNPLQTGKWLLKAGRLAFYNRIEYVVYVRSLEEPLPAPKSDLPLRFQVADQDSFESLRDIVPPSEFKRLKKRLMSGRRCLLTFWGDKLAHYSWSSDRIDFETDNLKLKLAPGDSYLDDSYTVPAYRGRGIYTLAHLQQLRSAKEKGFKRCVAIVDIKNSPPHKVLRGYSYQELDRILFRRILTKRTWRSKTGKF